MKRYTFLVTAAIVFLVVALTGCGGDDDTTTATQATTTEPAVTKTETIKEISTAEAKDIFVKKCGSCHALKAAGTTGESGPDLDEHLHHHSLKDVEKRTVDGGEKMPANILNKRESKAVVKWLTKVKTELSGQVAGEDSH